MNSVFVYNDVMRKRIQKILKLEPISSCLAETEGKMYNIQRVPIMLMQKDITFTRGTRRMLGSILTFDESQMERVLHTLEDYHGSSLSRIGFNAPNDLMYSSIIKVYPITFNNIQELKTYRYKYKAPIKCCTWLGNPECDVLVHALTVNRHKKITNGVYKKGLIDVLKQDGYL